VHSKCNCNEFSSISGSLRENVTCVLHWEHIQRDKHLFMFLFVVHLRHPHTYTHTKANNCLKNENEFSDLHIYLPFCCIILLKLFRKSDPRMEFSTQSASGYQCEWVTVLPLSGKKIMLKRFKT